MSTVRVSCIQYQLRPIQSFQDFADQVTFFVESSKDYDADFALLPELFTTQLMSFLPERDPVNAIRHLAEYSDRFIDLLVGLARRLDLHLVGGTHPTVQDGRLYNTCHLVMPDGAVHAQHKVHLTPSERTYWHMSAGDDLRVFDTEHGRVAIAICYDVEFPEFVRKVADAGAKLLFVPSCTDDRHGYLRVLRCSQARAIENQMFVALTGTVGNLPRVKYMATNYGCAGIYTPSDFPFARDGVAAQGDVGQEMIIVADLDLSLVDESRNAGTVRPYLDRRPEIYESKVDQVTLKTPAPSPASDDT